MEEGKPCESQVIAITKEVAQKLNAAKHGRNAEKVTLKNGCILERSIDPDDDSFLYQHRNVSEFMLNRVFNRGANDTVF